MSDMVEDHQEVVHKLVHEDTEGGNGVANILRAFMRNPVAAAEIIGFVITGAGVYYALEGEIGAVRAAQIHNFEQLTAKMDVLIASDNDEKTKIAELYSRGDVRYQQVLSKIGDQEVALGKLTTGIDYLIKQTDRNAASR